MTFDFRDVLLYGGIVLIGSGLWWWWHPGAGIVTVGVLLFGLGLWTSMGGKHAR